MLMIQPKPVKRRGFFINIIFSKFNGKQMVQILCQWDGKEVDS